MSCQANTELIEALYEEALVEVNGDEAKAEEIDKIHVFGRSHSNATNQSHNRRASITY